MTAEQPLPESPPPPVVVHIPVVTTETIITLDGTSKTITTTDGVISSSITGTDYQVFYNPTRMFKRQNWSDNTSYSVEIAGIVQNNNTSFTGVFVEQYQFYDPQQVFVNGMFRFPSPYPNVVTVISPTIKDYVQNWSDGTSYTLQQQLTINGSYKTISKDGVTVAYVTGYRYVVEYASKTANSTAFMLSDYYRCFKWEDWSDGTSVKDNSNDALAKTQLANVKSITNVEIPQFKFALESGVGFVTEYVGAVAKTVFPYLVTSVLSNTPTSSRTDTWSDGRTYTKTY